MSEIMSALSIFLIICFSFIFVVGVFGNILVIQTFHLTKPASSRVVSGKDLSLLAMETIICYLAGVDLIASICNPFLYIYYEVTQYKSWHLGKAGCLILGTINSLMDTVSCGLILTIMIERCIVMCFPFKKRLTINEVRKAVVIVLVISILFELPYIMHLEITNVAQFQYKCQISKDDSVLFGEHKPFPQNETFCIIGKSEKPILSTNGTFLHAVEYFQLCSNTTSSMQLSLTNCYNNRTAHNTTFNATTQTHLKPLAGECSYDTCNQIYNTCLPRGDMSYIYSRVVIVIIRDCSFLIVFIVCIYLMYKQMKGQETVMQGQCTLNPKKTLYMLISIAVVFYILVLPRDIFHLIHNLYIIAGDRLDEEDSFKANAFLKILQCSNCISNIFIYAQLHNKFRQRIKELRYSISEIAENKGDHEPKAQLLTVATPPPLQQGRSNGTSGCY